jgi:peptidoglycan hydrolase CwlO-like protein
MQTFIAVAVITMLTELVLFFLLMRHVKMITKLFSQYSDSNIKEAEIEDKIGIYQEKIIELEDTNKKLELENKLLQEKINKINKQMKQISDHFKSN